MYPVSDVKIVGAQQLEVGQFAYIEQESGPALIGRPPSGDPLAIFLDDWAKENLAELGALNGFAVALDGARFEVNFATAERCEPHTAKIGSLVRRDKTLALVCHGRGARPAFIFVGEVESETSGYTVAFTEWRLVRKEGDRLHTLYEKKS